MEVCEADLRLPIFLVLSLALDGLQLGLEQQLELELELGLRLELELELELGLGTQVPALVQLWTDYFARL
jgi:hypothetical protein